LYIQNDYPANSMWQKQQEQTYEKGIIGIVGNIPYADSSIPVGGRNPCEI
jgi:hypothetical protein